MRLLALFAAVTAAALLPHAPVGVNFLVVAVLVAVAAAMRASRRLDTWLFGGLALALAAIPVWLDAGWIVAISLVAAVLLAGIAAGGLSVLAVVSPIRALEDAPALMPKVEPTWMPAVRGVLVGWLLVLVFGGLFWTADAVFAELGAAVPFPSGDTLLSRILVFVVVLVFAIGLALACHKPPSAVRLLPGARVGRFEWLIPLALLNVLFAVFVAVQVSVLFGDDRHVLETAGLSYAEYAREGFWQLIVATTLTLVVIGAALRLSNAHTKSDRLVLRALIAMLCVLTLVIVASALRRLELYEDAFGLTRSRLAAEAMTFGLGALFVLILLAGLVRPVRMQLARIAVSGAAVALLAFALSNPDGRIAERNVERWRETGRLDIVYAQSLSADAVPALDDLAEPTRGVVLAAFSTRLDGADPWTSWNRGRSRARAHLSDHRSSR